MYTKNTSTKTENVIKNETLVVKTDVSICGVVVDMVVSC